MKFSGLLFLWALSLNARAYHIDDHRLITRQAFQELTACFPKAKALLSVQLIVNGDVDEDLDLITKWLFYSHYYNPNKKLDMRRADSAERVASLASSLHASANDPIEPEAMDDLGHMIHHFQDATVPAHVVPVEHSMWDGFESYHVMQFSSGLSCDQIATLDQTNTATILKETALKTLANVQAFQYGQQFWVESKDNEFGQYGVFGNNFGETDFNPGGMPVHIDNAVYYSFKMQQLELATQATIRGLMWELGDQLKSTINSCVTAQSD
jgi:hypothetical protein